MRIAIVSDTLFPEQVNGVARVAASSAAKLAERGHEVRVWSVRDVPSFAFWGYQGERMAVPVGKAFRELRAFKPDIIHVHTPFGLGWEAVATSKMLGIPVVGTHHTFFDHYLKHVHLDSALMRELSWKYLVLHYNRYDVVLSPSQALLDAMKNQGLRPETLFFPNGIDTDFFAPPAEPRKKHGASLIFMGRVSYEKSIDQVIRAFNIVCAKRPDATLTIIGDGPEKKKLEVLVHHLGLDGHVIFAGMLHGQAHLEALQSADVFLTAAKTENMPLALIEAMAVGLPVVGVDALGIPEIVQDGENGYIVPVDNPQAMAEKTLALLEDDERRAAFAKAARERALEYGEDKHAEGLEKIYNSLLK